MIPIITIHKDSLCYYLGRDKTREVAINSLNTALAILVTRTSRMKYIHNRKLFFSSVGSLA